MVGGEKNRVDGPSPPKRLDALRKPLEAFKEAPKVSRIQEGCQADSFYRVDGTADRSLPGAQDSGAPSALPHQEPSWAGRRI